MSKSNTGKGEKKCPECGTPMTEMCDPGLCGGGDAIPDWSCPKCGWALFPTATEQEARAAEVARVRREYEEQTGFLPGR